MSWRDDLHSASFRNVPFHVEGASGSGGRRIAVHEFPNRDEHSTEDLGQKSSEGRITAFVIGDDYHKQRDALMQALDAPDDGDLIHPYFGSMRIRVTDYDWSITTRKGGYCKFTISYVLAGGDVDVVQQSSVDELKAAADKVADDTKKSFADNFDASGADVIRESSIDILGDAVSTLRTVNGRINSVVSDIQGVSSDIEALGKEISTLINAPAKLISTAAGVISSVVGAFNDVENAFKAYDQLLAGFKIKRKIKTTARNGVETATRLTLSKNQNAISTAFSMLSTVSTIKQLTQLNTSQNAGASVQFETVQQARSIRDALVQQLDDALDNDDVSYEQYESYTALTTALQRYITEIEPALQRSETITLNTSLPALVVCHTEYGDALRAEEFARRNKLPSTLLTPPSIDLEVLR